MNEQEITRLRLDIAYDGTDFAGWGTQPDLRTVQGTIEGALAVIFRRQVEIPRLVVAGRTDAGVHATGQVAHLDLTPAHLQSLDRTKRSPRANNANNKGAPALVRRINGILGLSSDVVVAAASVAPVGFDARFSALWRRYEYKIADSSVTKNPILRNYVLAYPALLDEKAMDAAAAALVGLHDWASYCKPRERATTIRELQDFRWERDEKGILIARVKADAFCHSMVRSLVGACVAVGAGKLEPTDLLRLRDAGERSSEFKVMPAKGLTLVKVGYPADAELALRAAQTRTRRDAVAPDADDGLE